MHSDSDTLRVKGWTSEYLKDGALSVFFMKY